MTVLFVLGILVTSPIWIGAIIGFKIYEKRKAEKRKQYFEEQDRLRKLKAEKLYREERERAAALEQRKAALEEQLVQNMDAAFQKVPGWNVWDVSIHRYPGQIERMGRTDNVSVVAYDPKHQIAKIKGAHGQYYLTKADGCSCMDFKKRGIPCKHMYALALHLCDGLPMASDPYKDFPFYGLTFALAGRFPGRTTDPDGIRAKISARKGLWTSQLTSNATGLVCGTSPAESKIQYAEENRIMVFQADELLSLFMDSETPTPD